MEAVYFVADARGGRGWFSRSSQFNSQMSEAKEFTRQEAIKLCRLYKTNGVILVPVARDDMDAINDQR